MYFENNITAGTVGLDDASRMIRNAKTRKNVENVIGLNGKQKKKKGKNRGPMYGVKNT